MRSTEALCVPELLENILQHLSPEQLFISQRVSRGWRRTIQQSGTLQRSMFLLPADPTTFWSVEYYGFEGEGSTLYDWDADFTKIEPQNVNNDPQAVFSARLNPFVCERYTPGPDEDFNRIDSRGDVFSLDQFFLKDEVAGASWRKTFLTQPPVREACFKSGGLATGSKREEYHTVNARDDSGLRAGDVMSELHRLFPRHNRSRRSNEDDVILLYAREAVFTTSDEEFKESFNRSGT